MAPVPTRFRGDVAVAGGRISEVGHVTAGLAANGVEVDGQGSDVMPRVDRHPCP